MQQLLLLLLQWALRWQQWWRRALPPLTVQALPAALAAAVGGKGSGTSPPSCRALVCAACLPPAAACPQARWHCPCIVRCAAM